MNQIFQHILYILARELALVYVWGIKGEVGQESIIVCIIILGYWGWKWLMVYRLISALTTPDACYYTDFWVIKAGFLTLGQGLGQVIMCVHGVNQNTWPSPHPIMALTPSWPSSHPIMALTTPHHGPHHTPSQPHQQRNTHAVERPNSQDKSPSWEPLTRHKWGGKSSVTIDNQLDGGRRNGNLTCRRWHRQRQQNMLLVPRNKPSL